MKIRKTAKTFICLLLVLLSLWGCTVTAFAQQPASSSAPTATEEPEIEFIVEEGGEYFDASKLQDEAIVGTVIADQVNMRFDPDVNSPAMICFPQNAKVMILSVGDEWSLVEYALIQGYIRNDFLLADGMKKYCFILNDGTNLRKEPSTSSEVVTTLEAGLRFDINDYEGDWFKVSNGKHSGYIHRQVVLVSTSVKGSTVEKCLVEGMKGDDVIEMQKKLRDKGFFPYYPTGLFGEATKDALMDFQQRAGITVDGIAGPTTLSVLAKSNITSVSKSGNVKKVDWFKGGNSMFTKWVSIQVIDVATGISYNVRRFGGYNHADVEPMTADDTAKLKKTYGGVWSWTRRAVWVKLNGTWVAGSINGMPHGSDTIAGNNMQGQICIHLTNSKTHGGQRVDEAHQACINRAYAAGN